MFEFLKQKPDTTIITEITESVCKSNDIYLKWAFPKIIEKNFKCQYCGKTKNIHVEYDLHELQLIVKTINNRLNPSDRSDYSIKHKVQEAVVEELLTCNSLDHSVVCSNCSK